MDARIKSAHDSPEQRSNSSGGLSGAGPPFGQPSSTTAMAGNQRPSAIRPLPWVELEPHHRRAKSKHWASDKAALFVPAAIPHKKAARPLPVDPGVIMVELP